MIKWIGLSQFNSRLERAPKVVAKDTRTQLVGIGRLVAGAVKARIGPGAKLGSVSGETAAGINFKYYRRGTRQIVVIGPSNRKGNLLRIHEEGLSIRRTSSLGQSFTASYPKRPTVGPAVDETESQIDGKLGQITRRI